MQSSELAGGEGGAAVVDGGTRGVGDIASGFGVGAGVDATISRTGVAIGTGVGSLIFESDSVAFERSCRFCGAASPTTLSKSSKKTNRRKERKAAVYIFQFRSGSDSVEFKVAKS